MISPLAHIHPGAKIGENCTIEPFVYIEDNVVIGDNCHIMALWPTSAECGFYD